MQPESENHKIRMTYTDGESIGSVESEAEQPGQEIFIGALSEFARAMGDAIHERANADPEYVATLEQRDATPWYRFRRRKKLSELAMKLHTEAFFRQVGHVTDSIEIIDIQNRPQ